MTMEIGSPMHVTHGVADHLLPGETDNLTNLEQLNEEILLLELNVRYNKGVIYTYVGDILCAINPYKKIPGIYNKEATMDYTGLQQLEDKPPHLFALADRAFTAMSSGSGKGRNQVCVISGESGAGKTESAKLFISHLIHLSTKTDAHHSGLEDKIIKLNPLLESLGNAQTNMNDNSSRFGKFIDLWFNDQLHITGATIRQYLLEKSRVIHQLEGEQNFHIFYILFAGLRVSGDDENFDLGDPLEHRILADNDNAVENIESEKMAEMYREVVDCIRMVGFDEEEKKNIFQMLAGILHLGDIEFGGGRDPAYIVSSEDDLRKVATQLGLDLDPLKTALIETTISARGESTVKQYAQAQAEDARDALCKEIYSNLFNWVIQKVNKILDGPERKPGNTTIGILDIFGFEVFEENSFEQLLINLTNEQLQMFFNQHIFSMELAEYEAEGIDAAQVQFTDNKELLEELLLGKTGVLKLIDEESKMPRGSDESMLEKFHHSLNKFDTYSRPKGNTPQFSITHYAGEVTYQIDGFLDKNRDTLALDLVAVMRLSSVELISGLFGGEKDGKSKKAKNKKDLRKSVKKVRDDRNKSNKATTSQSFTKSLKELMVEMDAAAPHFIRCIKPNLEKKPNLFKIDMVTTQLRYTGMLETTRIRKEGYSSRPTFADFIDRYKCLGFQLSAHVPATAASCASICNTAKITDWQMGKTKVFLRFYHSGQLNLALKPFPDAAAKIQTAARIFSAQNEYNKLLEQKQKEEKAASDFLSNLKRQGAGMMSVLEALCEDDALRPPDYFEQKRKNTKKIKDPTLKRMQKQADKSKAGLSRAQSVKWFKEVEMKKGAGMVEGGDGGDNGFQTWFHGIITRNEANTLLAKHQYGAFLVRVSESRFGYSLSHYVEKDKIKHYMIDQNADGQYIVVGNKKLFNSLNELVSWHSKHKVIASDPVALVFPCGQEEGHDDLEEIYAN